LLVVVQLALLVGVQLAFLIVVDSSLLVGVILVLLITVDLDSLEVCW
jgi:hypothetical protein